MDEDEDYYMPDWDESSRPYHNSPMISIDVDSTGHEADLPSTRFFQGSSNSATNNASKSTLNKLFDSYREDPENEPDEVNINGTMQLLGDISVDPEDVATLIFSELVNSPSLGKLTRTEFVDSLSALG